MDFADIEKRTRKREESAEFGFWHKITNTLGNSATVTPIIAIITPMILSVITMITLLSYSLKVEGAFVDGTLSLVMFILFVLIVQVVVLFITYAYIGYVSYHQIKYDINRITGIITIGIMTLSVPSLLSIFGFLV